MGCQERTLKEHVMYDDQAFHTAQAHYDAEVPEWIDDEDDGYLIDGVGFADPGGESALRAATRDNPRDQPCRQCGEENVLTRLDVAHGYCCDVCASRNDGTYAGADY